MASRVVTYGMPPGPWVGSGWLIGAPTTYIFGIVLGWEGVGVWLGLVTGLACAAIYLQARFWALARDVPADENPSKA